MQSQKSQCRERKKTTPSLRSSDKRKRENEISTAKVRQNKSLCKMKVRLCGRSRPFIPFLPSTSLFFAFFLAAFLSLSFSFFPSLSPFPISFPCSSSTRIFIGRIFFSFHFCRSHLFSSHFFPSSPC